MNRTEQNRNFKNLAVTIENTTLCGGNCIICKRDEFKFNHQIMSMECFKLILTTLADLGVCDISIGAFGDPLLDPYLEVRLKFIRETIPSSRISTTTTGHVLSGENVRIVCEYMDVIKISNYGFSKESYESVHRGSLKFEAMKQNIDSFLVLKQRPYTILSFIDLPQNHHEMELWMDYYEPKCDRIDIWKPHYWAKGGEGTICVPCKRALCLDNLIFRTDGSVSLCCLDFNRELIIGNILNDVFIDIVDGEKYNKIKEIHKKKLIQSSDLICKDCEMIRDRSDALLYSSDKNMKVGKRSLSHI